MLGQRQMKPNNLLFLKVEMRWFVISFVLLFLSVVLTPAMIVLASFLLPTDSWHDQLHFLVFVPSGIYCGFVSTIGTIGFFLITRWLFRLKVIASIYLALFSGFITSLVILIPSQFLQLFVTGGVMADSISLYDVLSGDKSYDYMHNLITNKDNFYKMLLTEEGGKDNINKCFMTLAYLQAVCLQLSLMPGLFLGFQLFF